MTRNGEQQAAVKIVVVGHVDHGKSTLIGRLLHDSKSIFEDQFSAISKSSAKRGLAAVDFSLLTDGLQAEREQGITIDVAYRYFATPKRKFIIGDTPGHEQYTRNMVTAASTANLVVILVDARKGVLVQTRRHTYLASLVGIPHIVLAVNKMDMVDYSESRYREICTEYLRFAAQLGLNDITCIPLSAFAGDMIVDRGDNMDWYQGTTLMNLLENIEIDHDLNTTDFRYPVQWVCRPQTDGYHDFRGFMGRIEAGEIAVGDQQAGIADRAEQALRSGDQRRSLLVAEQRLGEADVEQVLDRPGARDQPPVRRHPAQRSAGRREDQFRPGDGERPGDLGQPELRADRDADAHPTVLGQPEASAGGHRYAGKRRVHVAGRRMCALVAKRRGAVAAGHVGDGAVAAVGAALDPAPADGHAGSGGGGGDLVARIEPAVGPDRTRVGLRKQQHRGPGGTGLGNRRERIAELLLLGFPGSGRRLGERKSQRVRRGAHPASGRRARSTAIGPGLRRSGSGSSPASRTQLPMSASVQVPPPSFSTSIISANSATAGGETASSPSTQS